jgi:peptide/nickel transport system permease protein
MLTYLFKRLLLLLPTLYIVVTLVFFLIRLIPGDPVDFILGDNALPESRAQLIAAHHFDEPLISQYSHYLGDVMHGNLGQSYFSDKSVNQQIAERYPATAQLALTALLWAILIAFPLGMIAAVYSGGVTDQSILSLTLLGISVPGFYLGPLLALLFSIKLDWFPLSGRELPGSVILPSLTLGLAMAALLTRLVRTTMLDVLHKDYVRTARAKGVHPALVVVKHAFRTALIPVVAVLGLQLGTLLTGAVVTEKIFSWPGLGSLMLEAISRRDYAVVQGCVLLIAAAYAIVNLMTDVVYGLIDPRVRLH